MMAAEKPKRDYVTADDLKAMVKQDARLTVESSATKSAPKIYKYVVTSGELESHTSSGWQLERILGGWQNDSLMVDGNVYSNNNSNSMSGGISMPCKQLLFLLSKTDEAGTLQAKTEYIAELEKKITVVEAQRDMNAKNMETLAQSIRKIEEDCATTESNVKKSLDARDIERGNYDRILAKMVLVRDAIGMIRLREIIGQESIT